MTHWLGLGTMIAAAFWSNFVMSRMAKSVNVEWHFKSDKAAREAIRKYRQQNGNGPIFGEFLLACGLAAIGGVVMICGK